MQDLINLECFLINFKLKGQVSERSKVPVLKTGVLQIPEVRILPCPSQKLFYVKHNPYRLKNAVNQIFIYNQTWLAEMSR